MLLCASFGPRHRMRRTGLTTSNTARSANGALPRNCIAHSHARSLISRDTPKHAHPRPQVYTYRFVLDGKATFGHMTSNVVEQVNSAWVKMRHESVLHFLDRMCCWVGKKLSIRQAIARKQQRAGATLTPYGQKLWDKQALLARELSYVCEDNGDGIYSVRNNSSK